MAALELLDGHIDALVTTMLATGGVGRGDAPALSAATASGADGLGARAIEALDVPVIQAVCVDAVARRAGTSAAQGLLPIDAATQVAIPEFDGRIIGGLISFKERDAEGSPVGAPVPHYVPDAERCDRLARLVVRHARLRDPARRAADRDRADRVPDQARPDRDGRRAGHAGERDAAARTRCAPTGSKSSGIPGTATS